MAKNRQQFINDYATRAIENGMPPSEAWAEAASMADRAISKGHIAGDDGETQAAADRAGAWEQSRPMQELIEAHGQPPPAQERPKNFGAMRQGAAQRALEGPYSTVGFKPVVDSLSVDESGLTGVGRGVKKAGEATTEPEAKPKKKTSSPEK